MKIKHKWAKLQIKRDGRWVDYYCIDPWCNDKSWTVELKDPATELKIVYVTSYVRQKPGPYIKVRPEELADLLEDKCIRVWEWLELATTKLSLHPRTFYEKKKKCIEWGLVVERKVGREKYCEKAETTQPNAQAEPRRWALAQATG